MNVDFRFVEIFVNREKASGLSVHGIKLNKADAIVGIFSRTRGARLLSRHRIDAARAPAVRLFCVNYTT